jgi:hypothetical protein
VYNNVNYNAQTTRKQRAARSGDSSHERRSAAKSSSSFPCKSCIGGHAHLLDLGRPSLPSASTVPEGISPHYRFTISTIRQLNKDATEWPSNRARDMEDRSAHNRHNRRKHHTRRLPLWQRGFLSLGRHRSCTQCAPLPFTPSIYFSFDLTRWLTFNTQDIDVVVSDDYYDPEDIKEIIVAEDDRYYLKQSRKPGATHRILYCRLPGWATDDTRRVKVDILVPPTLNLPAVSASETCRFNNIPVMPIFDLLVMKTQGWNDHRNSYRSDFRAKEDDDVSDIFALLESAKQENVSYRANRKRHSREFMSHARTLVNEFVNEYGRPGKWRALGFPV